MDSSQLTRLRQEAANQYLARTRTVDSSLLTFKNQQRAAYAGSTRFNASPYYKNSPRVNPIEYDISSCPINHSFTDGYSNTLKVSQHDTIAMEKGGAAICGDTDYSKASPGIMLLNLSTCKTILTSYDNNTPAPGQWKAYGYGVTHYFPKSDFNSDSTCCTANKYLYPSA
jgi:hypothetical protein